MVLAQRKKHIIKSNAFRKKISKGIAFLYGAHIKGELFFLSSDVGGIEQAVFRII